ncbi:MAG: hypothetical protein WC494_01240 [Candidatus Pacearchaeota archaeon]
MIEKGVYLSPPRDSDKFKRWVVEVRKEGETILWESYFAVPFVEYSDLPIAPKHFVVQREHRGFREICSICEYDLPSSEKRLAEVARRGAISQARVYNMAVTEVWGG